MVVVSFLPMPEACPVYRPRKPHLTRFYQCVQDHFDTFEQVYEERFATRYGFWRPYLKEVIYRYLECGDLHRGFARLVCQTCGRNFFCLLMQAALLLPVESSETCGGVRRETLTACAAPEWVTPMPAACA